MRTFECKKGNSNKFWGIELNSHKGGKLVVTTYYGKIGTVGSSNQKVFTSAGAAISYQSNKITEKLGKGYKEVDGFPAVLKPAVQKKKKKLTHKIQLKATPEPKKEEPKQPKGRKIDLSGLDL